MPPIKVLVAGDVTVDFNIAQSPGQDGGYWSRSCARVYARAGGAALTADFIEAVAKAGRLPLRVMRPPSVDTSQALTKHSLPESYAVWTKFPTTVKAEDRVWRVKDFLGVSRGGGAVTRVKVARGSKPDIVVLDDANLGFRSQRGAWPKVDPNTWVILKVSEPVIENPLLNWLVKRCRERLVVIITANDLRLSDVSISPGISWERTAQNLAREFTYHPKLDTLRQCAHVIVSFPTTGVFLATRNADDRPSAFDLIYDARGSETQWLEEHPGGTIGFTTCLVGAIVRAIAANGTIQQLKAGIQSGLQAMRALHEHGYGAVEGDALTAGLEFPFAAAAKAAVQKGSSFSSLAVNDVAKDNGRNWSILQSLHHRSLGAMAENIAKHGPGVATGNIPWAQFGALTTLDRVEIEGYRSIGTLIREYERQGLSRPLSIAVFGPPGAGKSFAVKALAKSLSSAVEDITFNLAQFESVEALMHAFHRVRDIGLAGKLPLVFWDEFDTRDDSNRPAWLRHFLAPMQDGTFQQGEISHPIGKAIFVFAGGTTKTMAEFEKDAESFRESKGPDFVSRLKGHIDIVGPNPQPPGVDMVYIIRRAILLYSLLKMHAPHLFGGANGLEMDSGVLRAFLHIGAYKHGARSMESVIMMSALRGRRKFERSALPVASQMNLHVDAAEFQAWVNQEALADNVIEKLAIGIHRSFCDYLRESGYAYGKETSEEARTHSSLMPFDKLQDYEKEQNRDNARDFIPKLASIGCLAVVPKGGEKEGKIAPGEFDRLAKSEHDRWKNLKENTGWRYAEKTDKAAMLHQDLLEWDELSDTAKEKDLLLVRQIPGLLKKAGYKVVRVTT